MFAFDARRRQLAEAARPLEDLLRHFTYRPDWTFRVEEGQLIISAKVIDATNPPQIILLQFGIAVPSTAFLTVDFDWQRWLFEQIMVVERHEAQEFFRVKGVAVYDPHV